MKTDPRKCSGGKRNCPKRTPDVFKMTQQVYKEFYRERDCCAGWTNMTGGGRGGREQVGTQQRA